MAGNVVNMKVCSPLRLRSSLTGKYHAIRHYSYNLPLATSQIISTNNYLHDLKKEENKYANAQKQKLGSPSLQASLRCQPRAFLPPPAL